MYTHNKNKYQQYINRSREIDAVNGGVCVRVWVEVWMMVAVVEGSE